jgi:hypothetical protein
LKASGNGTLISVGAGASTSAWRMKKIINPIKAATPTTMGAHVGILVAVERREKLERRRRCLNMRLRKPPDVSPMPLPASQIALKMWRVSSSDLETASPLTLAAQFEVIRERSGCQRGAGGSRR